MVDLAPDSRPAWVSERLYPFESRFFAAPGGRMHYVDEGAGAPIVFVHGNPSWSFEFRGLISELRDRFRCIAPDHLGFGLSACPERSEEHHPAAHAANFAALMDHFDLDDATLFLTDWGGPIGLEFARRHPERVARLVDRQYLGVAGRRRLSLRGVQPPDGRCAGAVSDQAAQRIREPGHAGGRGRQKLPDARSVGPLPAGAAESGGAGGVRGASPLHRRRVGLAARDLGRPREVRRQAGAAVVGPSGHRIPQEGTGIVASRLARVRAARVPRPRSLPCRGGAGRDSPSDPAVHAGR